MMDQEPQDQFTWVPFLKELGVKLLEYQEEQPLLVSLLREAGIKQGLVDQFNGKPVPLEEIDPFTFASLIFKYGKDDKRTRFFRYIKQELGIKAGLPQDYYGVPKANAMSAWFFWLQG